MRYLFTPFSSLCLPALPAGPTCRVPGDGLPSRCPGLAGMADADRFPLRLIKIQAVRIVGEVFPMSIQPGLLAADPAWRVRRREQRRLCPGGSLRDRTEGTSDHRHPGTSHGPWCPDLQRRHRPQGTCLVVRLLAGEAEHLLLVPPDGLHHPREAVPDPRRPAGRLGRGSAVLGASDRH